ncbi:MAG: hypothetical protein ABIF08_02675 [Nanoarchaeota archaeon]
MLPIKEIEKIAKEEKRDVTSVTHDFEKADEDGRVIVIRNTEGMTKTIGEYAKTVGL